jgi:hypothetical protein
VLPSTRRGWPVTCQRSRPDAAAVPDHGGWPGITLSRERIVRECGVLACTIRMSYTVSQRKLGFRAWAHVPPDGAHPAISRGVPVAVLVERAARDGCGTGRRGTSRSTRAGVHRQVRHGPEAEPSVEDRSKARSSYGECAAAVTSRPGADEARAKLSDLHAFRVGPARREPVTGHRRSGRQKREADRLTSARAHAALKRF